jgi:murein DD-endopeptidase MepM/ murein hydrolase activator NlpD
MSVEDRGRHRAGRHAAPKPARKAPKRVGALFSAASVGSIGVTGASTLATPSATSEAIVAEPVTENTITIPISKVTDAHTSSLRAVAASRDDARQSLEDTAALNQAAAAADPSANPSVDPTPSVGSTERRALQAVTSTTNQIDDVVAVAQEQAQAQAEALLAQQNANQQSSNTKTFTAVRASGTRVVPIVGKYRLTARFGQHGRLWSKGWHTGLDFQVRSGTTVVAAEDGVIIKAGWAGAYGYRVEIAHAGGYVTAYNHLSKIERSSGVVRAGQEIGKSGNTGHTTGPHLHLEVTRNGSLVNPSSWLWG